MRLSLIMGLALLTALAAYGNPRPIMSLPTKELQPKLERGVRMEKERLHIGKRYVRVEYEFRNTTSEPITTVVSFPLPELHFDRALKRGEQYFSEIRAWEDDRPISLERDVRAFANGEDITDALRQAGVSIESYQISEGALESLKNLDEAAKAKLTRAGLLVTENPSKPLGPLNPPKLEEDPPCIKVDEQCYLIANWDCRIAYNWTQIFPPGKAVHLKHEYSPVVGYATSETKLLLEKCTDACFRPSLRKYMAHRIAKSANEDITVTSDKMVVVWLEYLLTTANAWQTPIGDFELVIEKEPREKVTFCWDGKIKTVSATQVRARKKNFIPDQELKIYFLDWPEE